MNNPFAIATAQAKKVGHSDFSEGSKGDKKRGEIAEALKKSSGTINEIASLMRKSNGDSYYSRAAIESRKIKPSYTSEELAQKKASFEEYTPDSHEKHFEGKSKSDFPEGYFSQSRKVGAGSGHVHEHIAEYNDSDGSIKHFRGEDQVEHSRDAIQQLYGTARLAGDEESQKTSQGKIENLGQGTNEAGKLGGGIHHKYIDREPKPGGGWTYTYPDDVKSSHSASMTPDDHREEASKLRGTAGSQGKSSREHAAQYHDVTAKAKENYNALDAKRKGYLGITAYRQMTSQPRIDRTETQT